MFAVMTLSDYSFFLNSFLKEVYDIHRPASHVVVAAMGSLGVVVTAYKVATDS
jgi:hypothetical protein